MSKKIFKVTLFSKNQTRYDAAMSEKVAYMLKDDFSNKLETVLTYQLADSIENTISFCPADLDGIWLREMTPDELREFNLTQKADEIHTLVNIKRLEEHNKKAMEELERTPATESSPFSH